MILNNSEKFYSMVLVVLLPKILMYIKPVLSNTQSIILIFFIMLSLVLSTYIIKSHRDRIPSFQKVKAPIKGVGLSDLQKQVDF
jgi:predicted membrane metal-binding protein